MLLEQASHAALNVHQTLSALEASVPLDFSMQLNDGNMAGEKRKEKKKKIETKEKKKKITHIVIEAVIFQFPDADDSITLHSVFSVAPVSSTHMLFA